MHKSLSLLALLCWAAIATTANAQVKTPQASPTATIKQDVGLGTVELVYSRPSAKGRKIFGELVPFNELWRTGANASTKLTFSEDVKVGGVALTKGTYALYTMPGAKEWSIVFYKNSTFWGAPGKDFAEADVAARFNVPVMTLRDMVETFTMNFSNLRNNGADLDLSWEMTKIVIPIVTDTDTKVMADIKNQLAGPSGDTYYSAARYYYEEKKDLGQALEWINKALDKNGEKYWMLRLKSNIQADSGKYKDAIATAERSMELAKTDGNNDYVRMNEKSIAEWKKK